MSQEKGPEDKYAAWLRYGLEQKGKTGKALARLLGVKEDVVSKMKHGKREIGIDEARIIRQYIDVPVPGFEDMDAIASGASHLTAKLQERGEAREAWFPAHNPAVSGEQTGEVLMTINPDWADHDQYAVRITDDSMNVPFRGASHVIVADISQSKLRPHHDDVVLIEMDWGDLRQRIIRRYWELPDGSVEWRSDSTTPDIYKTVRPAQLPEGQTYTYRGIVLHFYGSVRTPPKGR